MGTMTVTCDQALQPIGLVPVRHAVSALAREHVDGVVEAVALHSDPSRNYRSVCGVTIPAPLVIYHPELRYKELTARDTSRVSRRVLFARDNWRCQYCGFQATPGSAYKQLTVDHVKPAHLFESRRAATTWDNVTTACASCNRRKGGLLPMEAHMMPATTPAEPHYVQLRFAGRLNQVQRDYIADYYRRQGRKDIVL